MNLFIFSLLSLILGVLSISFRFIQCSSYILRQDYRISALKLAQNSLLKVLLMLRFYALEINSMLSDQQCPLL